MARLTPVNTGFTILEGTATGKYANRMDVWMEYAITNIDPVLNTCRVTVYFYAALKPGQTSATYNYQSLDSALQVNGEAGEGVVNGAYDFRTDKLHALGSFDRVMSYGTDGNLQLQLTGSFSTVSSYLSGGSVQAVVDAPPNPQLTTIRAGDAFVGDQTTVLLYVRNPAYTHSIACQFGNIVGYLTAAGTLSDTQQLLEGTVFPFTVPEEFYEQMPDAATSTCFLYCQCYLNGQPVGRATHGQLTVRAKPESCAPLVCMDVEETVPELTNLTGDRKLLIPGYSQARCRVQASARKGAQITLITVNGVPYTDQMVVAVGKDPVRVTVQDSRGFTVTAEDPQVQYLNYYPVSNLAAVNRDDPTASTATVTLSGQFWAGDFGVEPNDLWFEYAVDDSPWQPLTVDFQTGDGRYHGLARLEDLPYTQAHQVKVRVSDYLSCAEKTMTVPRGIPVFDWSEEDFAFHVPVSMPQLSCPELTELSQRIKELEELCKQLQSN